VRRLLLISFILGIGITATSSAAADTLTITPPSTVRAGTIAAVALGGTSSSVINTIALYAVPLASTCGANPGEEYSSKYPMGSDSDVLAEQTGLHAEQLYSPNIELTISTPGAYLLCGYLNQNAATASVQIVVVPSEAEEATTRAAQKAAEAQAKNTHEAEALHAQEVRERHIEEGPATLLRVKAASHNGRSSSHPGHTTLIITTSPLVHVTVTFNHHARPHHYQASGNEPALFEVEQGWSCSHPGLTYHYKLTAVGGSGSPLHRSGSFKTISSSKCAALKSSERRRSEEQHREAEEQKRKENSPEYKIEHAEDEYCEKVLRGSAGVTETVAGHMYTRCHISKTETHGPETIIVSESTA